MLPSDNKLPIVKVCTGRGIFSTVARLLDANYAARPTNAACAPTSSTAAFAVDINGKILKLDAEGNKKAAEAFKSHNSGAERAKEPNSQYSEVTAILYAPHQKGRPRSAPKRGRNCVGDSGSADIDSSSKGLCS
jgi:hypothetical protein